MKRRCYDPNYDSYKNYGAKGIKVCARWLGKGGFKNFLQDLEASYQPGLTLDRIDNNQDYSPENCRWASWTEQASHRSNTLFLTYRGATKSLSEWCQQLGLKYSKIWQRLYRRNWSIYRAFTTP